MIRPRFIRISWYIDAANPTFPLDLEKSRAEDRGFRGNVPTVRGSDPVESCLGPRGHAPINGRSRFMYVIHDC